MQFQSNQQKRFATFIREQHKFEWNSASRERTDRITNLHIYTFSRLHIRQPVKKIEQKTKKTKKETKIDSKSIRNPEQYRK